MHAPRAICSACVNFFFLNKRLSKENSRFSKPIFPNVSPHVRHLVVDCRSAPLSDGSTNVAMATNFRVEIGKIGLFAFIRSIWHNVKDCNIAILNC